LSIVKRSTRNNAPPQTPGMFALPPDTDVPPMTTTAIEASIGLEWRVPRVGIGSQIAPQVIEIAQNRLVSGGVYRTAFSPPAAVMTATMISPVSRRRTPALTPNVLSIVKRSTRNSAPPHTPGRFALPPDTDVPPMTTTAIEASRYSLPMSILAPRK